MSPSTPIILLFVFRPQHFSRFWEAMRPRALAKPSRILEKDRHYEVENAQAHQHEHEHVADLGGRSHGSALTPVSFRLPILRTGPPTRELNFWRPFSGLALPQLEDHVATNSFMKLLQQLYNTNRRAITPVHLLFCTFVFTKYSANTCARYYVQPGCSAIQLLHRQVKFTPHCHGHQLPFSCLLHLPLRHRAGYRIDARRHARAPARLLLVAYWPHDSANKLTPK